MKRTKIVEFTVQSLLVEIAESRFPDPAAAAQAVAYWSNVLNLPTGQLGARATLYRRIKEAIDKTVQEEE